MNLAILCSQNKNELLLLFLLLSCVFFFPPGEHVDRHKLPESTFGMKQA